MPVKKFRAVHQRPRQVHGGLTLADARYKSGLDIYLDVLTAQTALLNNQRTAMNLRMQQMTASVQLIKALGGGWDVSQSTTAAIP